MKFRHCITGPAHAVPCFSFMVKHILLSSNEMNELYYYFKPTFIQHSEYHGIDIIVIRKI